MVRVSIFLIAVALIGGMVGCAPVQYDLTVSGTEGGEVTTPGEGTFTYNKGTAVNLVAEPEEGYRFVNWTGEVGTIANVDAAITTIIINDHYSILANFALEIWEIRDWYDLDAIRNNLGGRYILMNDLDSTTAGYLELASETANQGRGWEPIGTSDDQFTGNFDGQGYEIKDLFIIRPDEDYVGLFGEVGQEGVTKDIGVVNVTVIGNDYVGGLVGHSDGTVSNSYSTGSVTGEEHVGSLVGHNGGIVSNSHSSGSATGDSRVGGLVGWNQATLSNSYSSCSVTGNSSVGGLVGDNWYYEGTVSNSYSTGSVTGSTQVGGLVGVNYYGSVTHSYSTGSVTGSSQVGGLVGYNTATVSNSFWDTETSGQATSDGGTGKTTAEMKNIATFLGAAWDITAVAPGETNDAYTWNIVNGQTYPFLSWQSVS
ncbi:MAG: GLUG motif-containing protein [Dehalococcoidia bacterium]